MRLLRFLTFFLIFLARPAFATADLTSTNVSAGGAAATTTVAGIAGVPLRACSVTVALAAAAGGATGIQTVNLRDGASGVGTILWTVVLSASASNVSGAAPPRFDIAGTPGNAMTLEFVAGGSSSAIESVALQFRQGQSCVLQ